MSSSSSPVSVAVIGLGQMGRAIAANLAAAPELRLAVWNRTAAKADGLAATVAATPGGAAAGASVVVTMLADDAALEAATFGAGGLVGALAPDAVHVGMSTISPGLAARLAAAHAEAGERYVSAPVFGRPKAAAARKLTIVPAGAADAIEAARPVLEQLGEIRFTLEHAQQANVFKLLANFMGVATIEILGEFLTAAEKAGLPRERVLSFLTGPQLGSGVVKAYAPMIAAGEFEPAGFALALGRKDVTLALDAVRELGTRLEVGELALEHIDTALERGRDALDWSALTTVVREQAGLEPLPGGASAAAV
ncbi:3-sulfolactaldehyde reductase [Baekduia alba]|uniref:NAD(P)-dependent oxidoreductase n=1 Tax=Baekduia alba TaxID=2997333 RepID=UPI0023408030|nr:NAD(P)-binding domain-containing protein [Baekduia alba]WCB96873.1 3-sulfolactaldehyde reductase [Baekduia alba]